MLLITPKALASVHVLLFFFFLEIKIKKLISYMYTSLNPGQTHPSSMPFLAALGGAQAIWPSNRLLKDCFSPIFLIQSLGT